jgi:Zinc carboxypeptidase
MKAIIILIFSILFLSIYSQESDWLTVYEKSDFKKTYSYEQTIEYSKKLAEFSDIIEFQIFGKSARGYDLPLLILDPSKSFDIQEIRKNGKAIVLFEAAIHPGEPDGIDAGLMLFRDIVVHNKFPELIENTVLLFIPSLNVDGHKRMSPYNRINQNGPEEMGWRTNSLYQNLNRDFLKIDSPELQAWVELYNKWLPDFFIDCHTTDGADYQYSLTYIGEDENNLSKNQYNWQSKNLIPYITKEMEKDGHLIFPYVAFRRWHDPRSGLKKYPERPALSHGYTAFQNRPGFLIETHMLKDYKTRVDATYKVLIHLINYVSNDAQNLVKMNKEADMEVAMKEFRDKPYPVQWTATKDSVMVEFKGIDYTVETSELTGGPWFKYNGKKATFTLPYFNQFEPSVVANLPEAYIIYPEWKELIKKAELHGVEVKKLSKETSVKINSYKFDNVQFSQEPFEGRHQINDFDLIKIEEERIYPEGSFIIDMNQRTAKIIAQIFEPDAPDSYIRWGFFNAIFEQKEYSETYVMEGKAREMLENNPELQKEFEDARKKNPELFQHQWPFLNWFFQHTEYWDQYKNVYPVGKIMDREIVNEL